MQDTQESEKTLVLCDMLVISLFTLGSNFHPSWFDSACWETTFSFNNWLLGKFSQWEALGYGWRGDEGEARAPRWHLVSHSPCGPSVARAYIGWHSSRSSSCWAAQVLGFGNTTFCPWPFGPRGVGAPVTPDFWGAAPLPQYHLLHISYIEFLLLKGLE